MSAPTPALPTPSQCIRTGLGGAGNFHRVKPATRSNKSSLVSKHHDIPITFTTGIAKAGSPHNASEISLISQTEELIPDHNISSPSPYACYYGIGGAGNNLKRSSSLSSTTSSSVSSTPRSTSHTHSSTTSRTFRKLKAMVHSQIEARNARVSVFEAWQRKLPSYSQNGPDQDKAYRSSSYKNHLSSSAASCSSEVETLTSRAGNLKERILWRLDRIAKKGLDEGMESSSPLYARL